MATMAVVAEEPATPGPAVAGDEVKPYKIHVSTKYLDLTRQKLELTRLPHEGSEPKSNDWWEPKAQVESLIDYWLEQYSWRSQEDALNYQLSMFRTAITVPPGVPIRLHFIHHRSTHPGAVPLLLIPPFPLTNLSLSHLIKAFTEPAPSSASSSSPPNQQTFHVVIPSLPGLGFSDALPNNAPAVALAARVLDALMVDRLGYGRYVATNAASAARSPAAIDWRLIRRLATHHAPSCVAAHLIDPALTAPTWRRDGPVDWAKWTIARLLGQPVLGYERDDFVGLANSGAVTAPPLSSLWTRAASSTTPSRRRRQKPLAPPPPLLGFGQADPNTLAYALCDSPVGLLVFVLRALGVAGGLAAIALAAAAAAAPPPPPPPAAAAASVGKGKGVDTGPAGEGAQREAIISPQQGALGRKRFTPQEIITMAQLAWLPGPEYALRFWAYCALHDNDDDDDEKVAGVEATAATPAKTPPAAAGFPGFQLPAPFQRKPTPPRSSYKPKVAITVFLGDDEDGAGAETPAAPAKPAPTTPAADPAPAAASASNDVDLELGLAPTPSSSSSCPPPLSAPPSDHYRHHYAPPAWARPRFDVRLTRRVAGSPRLLAWDRPDVIADGVRGLAAALGPEPFLPEGGEEEAEAKGKGKAPAAGPASGPGAAGGSGAAATKPAPPPPPPPPTTTTTAPLEKIVVVPPPGEGAAQSAAAPSPPPAPLDAGAAATMPPSPPARPTTLQEAGPSSSQTLPVDSSSAPSPSPSAKEKGKGKEIDGSSPAPPAGGAAFLAPPPPSAPGPTPSEGGGTKTTTTPTTTTPAAAVAEPSPDRAAEREGAESPATMVATPP